MPSRLFTAAWPLSARLEAAALCPVGVIALVELAAPGTIASLFLSGAPETGGVENLAFVTFGTSPAGASFGALLVAAGFALLIDRLLATELGVRIAACLTIAAWALSAAVFSNALESMPGEDGGVSTWQLAALTAAILAWIGHLGALRKGPLDLVARESMARSLSASSLEDRLNRAGRRRSTRQIIQGTPGLFSRRMGHGAGPSRSWAWAWRHDADGRANQSYGQLVVKGIAAALLVVAFINRGQITSAIAVGAGKEAREASFRRAADGSFVVPVTVNQVTLNMTFDSGARFVTLRAENAARLGVPLGSLKYTAKARIGPSEVPAAETTIHAMTAGGITFREIPALIVRPGQLSHDILGQSFTGRLSAWRIEKDRLLLQNMN